MKITELILSDVLRRDEDRGRNFQVKIQHSQPSSITDECSQMHRGKTAWKTKPLTVVFNLAENARTVQYFPIVIKPLPKIHWKIINWTLWGSSQSLRSQLRNMMIPVLPGLEVPIRHSTHGFGHNIYYHPNKISSKMNGRKSVSTHQSVDKPFLISKLLEAHELYKSQPGISNLLCAAFSLFRCSFRCQTGHSQYLWQEQPLREEIKKWDWQRNMRN